MTQQLPTGLTLAQINEPTPADTWNDAELTVASAVGLPTTNWEPGSPERVIYAVVANMLMQGDVAGSVAIQAGFLKFAAFGTVAWTDATGVSQTIFVTPDPSIPSQNPTGALGWLDVLADGAYDVRRILQGPASGTLAILNTQATTYGPFAPDSFHVSQPNASGSPTYSNAENLTIPQSASPGGAITGATNASPIAITTTNPHGRATGDIVFIAGVGGNTNANGAWPITVTGGSTYTLDGSAGNAGYTSGGNEYTPTLANFTADTQGTASDASAHTVNHAVTSLIGVSVDNYAAWNGTDTEGNASLANRCLLKLQSLSPNGPKGAYLFFALSAITLGPTLNPPVSLSTAITRAYVTSSAGVVTVTIANVNGAPSTPDLNATDAVIQAYCVPVSVTETTQKATNRNITVLASIYVPSQFTSTVGPIVRLAVDTYLKAVNVGGVTGPSANIVPVEGVRAAIEVACASALITVNDLTVTLNGGGDVTLSLVPTPEVPVFANYSTFVPGSDLTVVGV